MVSHPSGKNKSTAKVGHPRWRGIMRTQVPKCEGSPPHGRRPVRGDPGPGAPNLLMMIEMWATRLISNWPPAYAPHGGQATRELLASLHHREMGHGGTPPAHSSSAWRRPGSLI